MVFDHVRNRRYAAAIQAAVRPDSVVLDLGAGLGILGLMAARAGARRVYMVEPESVAVLTREIVRANGLEDRVVVLQGRIEDITLPEQVDLIVSVFTGNFLYSEDLLPALFHARERHLKPGGQLIPDRAELWVSPVSVPHLRAERIAQWAQLSEGLDFSLAQRFVTNEPVLLKEGLPDDLVQLGESMPLVKLDLSQVTSGDCDAQTAGRVTREGECHGLLCWIRIRLGQSWLSTHPEVDQTHWSPGFFPLDPVLPLRINDVVSVDLKRPANGDWSWSVKTGESSRRHSTFLAKPVDTAHLRRVAPQAVPGLNAEGRVKLDALSGMRDGLSNQALADRLALNHPGRFASVADALAWVQGLVAAYGETRQA